MSIDPNVVDFTSQCLSLERQIDDTYIMDPQHPFEEKGEILNTAQKRLKQIETEFKGKVPDAIFKKFSDNLEGKLSSAIKRLDDISKKRFESEKNPPKPESFEETFRRAAQGYLSAEETEEFLDDFQKKSSGGKQPPAKKEEEISSVKGSRSGRVGEARQKAPQAQEKPRVELEKNPPKPKSYFERFRGWAEEHLTPEKLRKQPPTKKEEEISSVKGSGSGRVGEALQRGPQAQEKPRGSITSVSQTTSAIKLPDTGGVKVKRPSIDVEALRKRLNTERLSDQECSDILSQSKMYLEDSSNDGALINDIVKFLGIVIQYHPKIKGNEEIIKLLALRGFDFADKGFLLLLRSKDSPEIAQMQIFYGADPSDHLLQDFVEPAVLRDEVVKNMYPGRDYKSLQFDERERVCQRCMQINQFRNEWINSSKWTSKMEAQEKFIKAFEGGNYKEAGELLKDNDIDINGPIRRLNPYGRMPLIIHALFSEKNIEAVKFLIDAGADVNVYYLARPDEKGGSYPKKKWLPPIMMAALNEIPNQAEVLELLSKAKADMNVKDPIHKRDSLIGGIRGPVSDSVISKSLPILIKGGLNPNLLSYWCRFFPKNDAARRALIFYGANFEYQWASDHPQICKIRDEALLEMSQELRNKQEEIMKEVEAMKRMSSQVIGVVGDFLEEVPTEIPPEKQAEYEKLRDEFLSKLTPDQRIKLHRRCEEIYKARHPS